jgi:hypothetical protein
MKYHKTQTYLAYSQDREFMQREGEPCRLCLYPLLEHHNGHCPQDDDDEEPSDDR